MDTQQASRATDIQQLLDDLNGGVLAQQVGQALSEVAAGVVGTGKAGSVTLKLDLKRIDRSAQVTMSHKLSLSAPTETGKYTDESTTSTVLHVNKGGRLTLVPEAQIGLNLAREDA